MPSAGTWGQFHTRKPIHTLHHIHKRTKILIVSSDKIQHPLMIKTVTKAGIEGTQLNIGHMGKPTVDKLG